MCNTTIPAGERQTYHSKPALWETNPELASQLVDPQDGWRLSAGSSKKVLWTCGRHEWETNVANRSKGKGCPYCSGKRACEDNCLATVSPELAAQLVDQSLATKLTAGSGKKVWWSCGKHEWKAAVSNRSHGNGCPFCSGRRATPETCLAAVNPELVLQLVDQSLATGLTAGSSKKVLWTCGKHEWEAPVSKRSSGEGCPYCSSNRACEDNCLATVNPELASRLVDQSLATELTAWSNKKVWWTCECGHSWRASVSHRSNGTGCPKCSSSKMNTWSVNLCESLGLNFKSEWRHDDCKSSRPLPFDIAILDSSDNPVLLIECQGKQHFEAVKAFGGDKQLAKQQKHDQIKRDFCQANDIPLLEIHFSQRDHQPEGYKQGQWFTEKLLADLLAFGIITDDQACL